MSLITVKLATAVRRSFRVEQVAGMFDVPLEDSRPGRACHPRVKHELTAEVPGLEEEWTIGAIVGPSGSGKTTLAKAAFGEAVYRPRAWAKDRAIIDVLGEGGSRDSGIGSREDGTRSVPTTELTIKLLTFALTSVGLGSPVTWLKPYHVLSGGEKFRADLCRAILRVQGSGFRVQGERSEVGGQRSEDGRSEGMANSEGGTEYPVQSTGCQVLVMDEFTSSLDRTVAKTTSAALGRLLRCQGSGVGGQESAGALRFVAVTCHRDILPWLSPDWTVELGRTTLTRRPAAETLSPSERKSLADASGWCGRPEARPTLVRGRPRRPGFRFRVERVPQAMWTRFSGEHYLSGGLAASATCYGAFWGGSRTTRSLADASGLNGRPEARPTARSLANASGWCGVPVAFCAVVAALGWPGVKRIQRLVTLPEFQGMGIGGKLLDVVAATQARAGFRVTITASHPAVIAHCSRSKQWRYFGIKKTGSTRQEFEGREVRSSVGRAVIAFEFVS